VTADKTSVEETAEAEETAEVDDPTDVEETADVESAENTADDGAAPGRRQRVVAALRKRSSRRVLWALLALLVAASLALLATLVYRVYLPDRDTDAAAAKAAIASASEGTVAVLSYSPETLDHDFSSAKSHLTGDFLKYYNQFTTQIVAPAAKQKSVKTTAVVLRAALSEFQANSATVLLFVNQSTQSKDRPEPTYTSSSVVVSMTKADGKWLISSFNPV
jgi:Mce-associated membrane protein